MSDLGSEALLSSGQETLRMNKELECMVETMENISVKLSWMAYDMVVQRTDPDYGQALRQLQEAQHLCETTMGASPPPTSTSTPTPTTTSTAPQPQH